MRIGSEGDQAEGVPHRADAGRPLASPRPARPRRRTSARRPGSQFPDEQYEANGARIGTVDEVWESPELLLKVKEPIASEYPRLRSGLVLFTYLHIAADEPLTRALVESGITAVAYETVETDDRRLPLLAPMSEVAGRLAAQAGATTSSGRRAAAASCSAASRAWLRARSS